MTKYYLGLDTETTGVEPENGDKIIEIALIQYDAVGNRIGHFIQRVDPERAINPQAQAVHGIAYSDLIGMPKFVDVAETIYDLMQGAELLIAHNFEFDGKFLAAELNQAIGRVPTSASFCTMENSRWACFDGKMPKLSEVCFALGVNYDHSKAHAADYDVEVMMQCFFKALSRDLYLTKTEQEQMVA